MIEKDRIVLLVDDKHKATTRLAVNLCGQLADGIDFPLSVAIIGKEGDMLTLGKAKRHTERLGVVGAIDACYIPGITAATGHYGTLAWIA